MMECWECMGGLKEKEYSLSLLLMFYPVAKPVG